MTPLRVLFVAEDGRLLRARTLEAPRADGAPIQLVVARPGRLELVKARQSDRREPGTWHREERAS